MIARRCLRYAVLPALAAGLCLPIGACQRAPQIDANKLLPASQLAAGWSRVTQPRVFPADELWRYIDGDAEKYVQAGVQTTVTAGYKRSDSIEANADVHVMSTPEAARKLFESDPAMGSGPANVGESGRAYSGSVSFRRHRYFVRLVGFNPSPGTTKALLELASSIDLNLPAN